MDRRHFYAPAPTDDPKVKEAAAEEREEREISLHACPRNKLQNGSHNSGTTNDILERKKLLSAVRRNFNSNNRGRDYDNCRSNSGRNNQQYYQGSNWGYQQHQQSQQVRMTTITTGIFTMPRATPTGGAVEGTAAEGNRTTRRSTPTISGGMELDHRRTMDPETIAQGYKTPFNTPPPTPSDPLKSHKLSEKEIMCLLAKKAIETASSRIGFSSRLILVPKKTGDLRPVLNLKPLNHTRGTETQERRNGDFKEPVLLHRKSNGDDYSSISSSANVPTPHAAKERCSSPREEVDQQNTTECRSSGQPHLVDRKFTPMERSNMASGTDSSRRVYGRFGQGMGIVVNNMTYAGLWNDSTYHEHINAKELRTVLLASQLPQLQGKVLNVICDNVTTIAHIQWFGPTMETLSGDQDTTQDNRWTSTPPPMEVIGKPLYLPSVESHPTDSAEAPAGTSDSNDYSSSMDQCHLVPDTAEDGNRRSDQDPKAGSAATDWRGKKRARQESALDPPGMARKDHFVPDPILVINYLAFQMRTLKWSSATVQVKRSAILNLFPNKSPIMNNAVYHDFMAAVKAKNIRTAHVGIGSSESAVFFVQMTYVALTSEIPDCIRQP
ncbi:hypothetical protein BGZ80_003180, partial [Entomortierella chlamydospora]